MDEIQRVFLTISAKNTPPRTTQRHAVSIHVVRAPSRSLRMCTITTQLR